MHLPVADDLGHRFLRQFATCITSLMMYLFKYLAHFYRVYRLAVFLLFLTSSLYIAYKFFIRQVIYKSHPMSFYSFHGAFFKEIFNFDEVHIIIFFILFWCLRNFYLGQGYKEFLLCFLLKIL